MKYFDSGIMQLKNRERATIQQQVEEFLSSGGTIRQLSINVSRDPIRDLRDTVFLPTDSDYGIVLEEAIRL